jgi:hypothetical protein
MVSNEFVGAAVSELARDVEPDLAANLPPAPAKRIILTQIGSGLQVDHAIKQGKEVGTLHRIPPGAGHRQAVHAPEMSFGISRNHSLQSGVLADITKCGSFNLFCTCFKNVHAQSFADISIFYDCDTILIATRTRR